MTRARVLQIGLVILGLGAIGYGCFRVVGFDGVSAGIAAEAILVLIVFGWTGTYLLRVLTGQMTFMEQRKRYLEAYEQITNADLQARFDSLPEEEQVRLMQEVDSEKNIPNS